MKIVSLFSGGLDSILAVKLIQSENLNVFGIFILTSFNSKELTSAKKAANYLKIPLKIIQTGDDYIDIIISPSHGYGKNMNPCIDCKIFMYKNARQYCKTIGGKFFITGEVLGERPMSQNKDVLLRMEKAAGCQRMVLRPLSAKLLPPTIAEDENIVDRTRLCNLSGRSRKPHIELANLLGLEIIPTPAGGCLLTDPGFSRRLKESIEHKETSSILMKLLSVGRHFRLPSSEKLIVSRTDEEMKELINYASKKYTLLKSINIVGLLIGNKDIELAAEIVGRYSRDKKVYYNNGSKEGWIETIDINKLLLSKYRL
ncbi:tRNA 4-thiouridine(8) synthase ThiI [candidate division WOR-3 bacterium]|nr:tRNA 4-thiouridine(8) synthase ThiI [candidate division WOR-3 bacterium]